MCKCNNGNPVPSIEQLVDEFFEKNQKYSDVKYKLAQYINTKLQNGVETNKEQPIKSECKRCKKTISWKGLCLDCFKVTKK